MLVYIPQLSARKAKLQRMTDRLPKVPQHLVSDSNIIDYDYANYNINQVEKDMKEVENLLSKAQTALDIVNNSATMEIEF